MEESSTPHGPWERLPVPCQALSEPARHARHTSLTATPDFTWRPLLPCNNLLLLPRVLEPVLCWQGSHYPSASAPDWVSSLQHGLACKSRCRSTHWASKVQRVHLLQLIEPTNSWQLTKSSSHRGWATPV